MSTRVTYLILYPESPRRGSTFGKAWCSTERTLGRIRINQNHLLIFAKRGGQEHVYKYNNSPLGP